jgi:CRISPR-associated exonuclease Cas4
MYSESDLLPISALQHLLFCKRQCALIHIERAWEENRLTAEGRLMHEKVHEAGDESRLGCKIIRGLHVRSLEFGISGIADAVEFYKLPSPVGEGPGMRIENHTPAPIEVSSLNLLLQGEGRVPARACTEHSRSGEDVLLPFPVEYKRGKPKIDDCDRVQLCAQALCLEEMLGVNIPEGALYYGKPHRRENVSLDSALREKTRELALSLHQLIRSNVTPLAEYSSKCKSCSLLELCMPQSAGTHKSAIKYVERMINNSDAFTNPISVSGKTKDQAEVNQ